MSSDNRLQDLILFVTVPGLSSVNEIWVSYAVKNDMLPVDLLYLADGSMVVEQYFSFACSFLAAQNCYVLRI